MAYNHYTDIYPILNININIYTYLQFHEGLLAVAEKKEGFEEGNAIVLDVRNQMESDLGHFHGSIPLGSKTYVFM